jgi:hypothetical protein
MGMFVDSKQFFLTCHDRLNEEITFLLFFFGGLYYKTLYGNHCCSIIIS